MTLDKSEFRCGHGHSGYAHPKCYERYVKGVDAPKKVRTAKILLLDIETLPGEYYAFDPRVDYLAPAMQIKDWSISCWAAKWLFSEEIMGEVVTPEEAIARDDKSILGGIWDLMNEAQIVVTQNGINFDLKKLSSRFIEHDMFPPSHFLNVDTLKTARETFGWSYNRLDEVGQKLGIGKKIPMNIDDWKKCLPMLRSLYLCTIRLFLTVVLTARSSCPRLNSPAVLRTSDRLTSVRTLTASISTSQPYIVTGKQIGRAHV